MLLVATHKLGKREQGGTVPSEGGPTPAGGPSRKYGGCPAGAWSIALSPIKKPCVRQIAVHRAPYSIRSRYHLYLSLILFLTGTTRDGFSNVSHMHHVALFTTCSEATFVSSAPRSPFSRWATLSTGRHWLLLFIMAFNFPYNRKNPPACQGYPLLC